jgi:choline dehydrogenase-like flavoprotein
LPDGTVLTSALERWCLPTNFGKEYLSALKQSQRIRLIYGLTCTNIQLSDGSEPHVTALQAKTLSRKIIQLKAKHYVLAGGALNTTRLLLASNQQHPEGIGNHSGLLGRYYMGHLSGDIATVQFTTPPQKTIYGFDRDIDQTYLRRRFSFSQAFQQEKQLTNTVAWLSTPRIDNPNHGSGVLSFSYLTLSSLLGQYLTAKAIRKTFIGQDVKRTYQAHLKNVLRDLGQTLTFVPQFGYQRYIAKRKIPGLFIYSASNEYTLHYHAEQVPNPDSRVTLSDETDELGMQRLNIDLRYSDQDIESVVRAHRYWDDYLKQHNCGYLKYKTDQWEASVWEQASDGFHQVGTTRMSEHPSDGVVDANCKVHHLENLFIASSAVFVTSGQANSTFIAVLTRMKYRSVAQAY